MLLLIYEIVRAPRAIPLQKRPGCFLEKSCWQRPIRTLEHNFYRVSSLQIRWNLYLP